MSEHVALNILIERNPGKQLVVDADRPISVLCAGVPWICTAVLERTAILVSGSDPNDRHPVRHENCMVDPAGVQWMDIATRPSGGKRSASPWSASHTAPRGTDAKKARDASDVRARKSQEQVAAATQRELEVQRVVASRDAAEAVKRDASYADIHDEEAVDPAVPTERSEFDDSFEAAEQRELEEVPPAGRPPALVLLRGQVERDQEAALEQGARYKPSREDAERGRFEEGVARLVREADEQFAEADKKRDNGDGNVRQRADGRWEVRVVDAGVRRSLYAHTEGEANAMLAEAVATADARRPEPMKFCPGCKAEKPKSAFPNGQGFFKCNECREQKVIAPKTDLRRAMERNTDLAEENMKHCPRCDRDLAREAFNRNSTKGDGLQAICRECQSDIYTTGSTVARRQPKEGDKPAHKMGTEITATSAVESPPPMSHSESEVASPEPAAAESPLKNQAAKPRRNGRPPLTFTELLNDLRQLSAYAAGLEKDNATLRAENEQFRDEQAGLYDELHAIVGGIKKATKERV